MFRLLVCLLSAAAILSARPKQVVGKTVPDHFRAISLDKQKLTGLLGSRIRANSEGFLENIEMQTLLGPIEADTSSTAPASDRQFPGLFLDAAADAYEYNHDVQLREQMDRVAAALAAFSARPAPPGDAQMTDANLLIARADLVGLLAYYRVTGEGHAYKTAQSISGGLMKQLVADETEQDLSAVARTGLIDPLVRLYRLSGDRKYLDFCAALAHALTAPEITAATSQSALVNTLWGLIGLADLYEVTGNAPYLQTAVAAWKQVVAGRLSIAGAPIVTGDGPREADACTAAAWLQFTFKLLRITGDLTYGDQLERTIYNQVLASQDARNGNISVEAPLNGFKTFSAKLRGQSGRCMLSEAKALALLPQLVWGRYETGIAINLFTPGRAFFTLRKHDVVQIYSEGAYPEVGQLQLHVEPSGKNPVQFPLRLRVPGWSDKFNVDVAGLHLTGRAGDVIIVDRQWKSGDTVRVSMSLPLRSSSVPEPNASQAAETVVLQRGPQVLALGKTLNPGIEDLNAAYLRPLSSGQYQIFNYEEKLPRDWSGDQLYRISGGVGGKPQDLLLVPFADALNYRTALRRQPDQVARPQ